jgi:hypothetical protein
MLAHCLFLWENQSPAFSGQKTEGLPLLYLSTNTMYVHNYPRIIADLKFSSTNASERNADLRVSELATRQRSISLTA